MKPWNLEYSLWLVDPILKLEDSDVGKLRYFFQERGSEVAEELERKAHNFLTDVKSKKKPALQVRPVLFSHNMLRTLRHELRRHCQPIRPSRAMTRTAASANGRRKRRLRSACRLLQRASPCRSPQVHLLPVKQLLLPHLLPPQSVPFPLPPSHPRWWWRRPAGRSNPGSPPLQSRPPRRQSQSPSR